MDTTHVDQEARFIILIHASDDIENRLTRLIYGMYGIGYLHRLRELLKAAGTYDLIPEDS